MEWKFTVGFMSDNSWNVYSVDNSLTGEFGNNYKYKYMIQEDCLLLIIGDGYERFRLDASLANMSKQPFTSMKKLFCYLYVKRSRVQCL